jgi:hypothetical protein
MPRRIQLFNDSPQAEQPPGEGLPVGIEGNNPGNIKASGNRHPGQVGVIYSDRGTAFKLFRTMADGVAAQAELIMRYQESDRFTGILANHVRALEQRNPHYEDMQRYRSGMNARNGINNLAELIIVYAPPTDANRTHEYIEFVVNDVQRTLRQRAATLRGSGSGNEAEAAALEEKAANFSGTTDFKLREDPVLLAAVQEAMMKMEIGTDRFNRYVTRANVDAGVRRIMDMSPAEWEGRFSRIATGQLPADVDENPYGQTPEERRRQITVQEEEDSAAQDMFGQTILGFLALLFAAMFNIDPSIQNPPAPNGTGEQASTTTGQFANVSSVFSADSRRFFDTNGDGRVLAHEVHYLFEDLNAATTDNIKIRPLDTNSNSVIDMDEAVRLDRDGNGSFDQADVDAIRQMLRDSGVTQTGGAPIPPPSAPVVQQRQ